jgi:hypothetical protein
MKRCPKCGRTFTKDTQKFCTHDGGPLVPAAIDPNTTVRGLPDQDAMNAPTTAISEDQLPPAPPEFNPYATVAGVRLPQAEPEPPPVVNVPPPPPPQPVAPLPVEVIAPAPPNIPSALPPPEMAAPPAPPIAPPVAPAVSAPTPVVSAPWAPQKKSKLPLILGLLAVLLLLGGGGLVAGYFFFLKPMLAEQARNLRGTPPETNENTNANVATPLPTAQETPTVEAQQPPPFQPPADAVEFVNSSDNLDGKLAEHYLDFSFYYPNSWKKDPQAGVPGASSFVNVQQRLTRDTPERFAVGWYTSRGSLAADLPFFPKLISDFSTTFGKGYPAYRKLSEGQTKVNDYDAYEFRFQSVANDVTTWGRVIFLPPASGTNGATLFMLATSEQGDVTGAEDVGEKGELPLVLESFRLGPKR